MVKKRTSTSSQLHGHGHIDIRALPLPFLLHTGLAPVVGIFPLVHAGLAPGPCCRSRGDRHLHTGPAPADRHLHTGLAPVDRHLHTGPAPVGLRHLHAGIAPWALWYTFVVLAMIACCSVIARRVGI